MKLYGCMDMTLSDNLKCIIKQGDVAVIGKLPEGFSSSLQHNWESPFADDSPGSIFQKAGAGIQTLTGKTMKGSFNTLLTWEGSEAKQLTIPLFFEAESDPKKEVFNAVKSLEAMSSPDFDQASNQMLNNLSADSAIDLLTNKASNLIEGNIGNRIPQVISVKIGKVAILRKCVIESVEVEDPMIYGSEGYPLQLSCTLNIKTRSTLSTTDFLKEIV